MIDEVDEKVWPDYLVMIQDPSVRTVADIEQSLQDLEWSFNLEYGVINRKRNKLVADYLDAKRKLEAELERITSEL